MSVSEAERRADRDPASRAEALAALGRHVEAIPWLQRAIAADPDAVEPRCRLALALLRLGKHREAVQAADQAVGVDPNSEWAHRLRSLALLRSKRKKDALGAAREAVRLAPEVPDAYVVYAEAELANGHKDAARIAAERAVALAPERAVTHETLGEVLLELRRLPESEQAYRRALALDPQSFEAMNNLGVVLQHQGREREAMDQFLAAARLNPASDLAQKNLANSIDRHTDPRPDLSRPIQIGLFLLGIVLPPVRLVMLAWWLVSVVIRKSRRNALPPVMQLGYGLRRRSRYSASAVLCCLGVVGALMFGVLAPALTRQRAASDLIVLYTLGVACLILAVVTSYRLWQRRAARQADA